MSRFIESARTGDPVAKLYEMRNRAKLLLGERYGEEMRRLRRVIEVVQSERGGSPLSAATKICQALASRTDWTSSPSWLPRSR